jgi:hypothetical protein
VICDCINILCVCVSQCVCVSASVRHLYQSILAHTLSHSVFLCWCRACPPDSLSKLRYFNAKQNSWVNSQRTYAL